MTETQCFGHLKILNLFLQYAKITDIKNLV